MDVVHVEQKAAARPPGDFGDEVGLRIVALGEGEISRRVFEQHAPPERLLDFVDMLGDAR